MLTVHSLNIPLRISVPDAPRKKVIEHTLINSKITLLKILPLYAVKVAIIKTRVSNRNVFKIMLKFQDLLCSVHEESNHYNQSF